MHRGARSAQSVENQKQAARRARRATVRQNGQDGSSVEHAFLAARNESCRADLEYLRSILPDQD